MIICGRFLDKNKNVSFPNKRLHTKHGTNDMLLDLKNIRNRKK
jgi:hypothetical protein